MGGGESRDRPRILVCAPSNTAVDELVYRIMTQVGDHVHYVKITVWVHYILIHNCICSSLWL
ncbi:hypothetical protein EON65_38965 [archaeon]|nr:MAG: hypothetical protein EON65_38965 [archaeon]